MKKLLIFPILFGLFFLLPVFVHGQELSERWVCLRAVKCEDSTECSTKKDHRARLTADASTKPLPNSETYIVTCLSTNGGQICSTGNATTDNTVFKKDNVSALNTAVGSYTFQGLYAADGKTIVSNPTTSDSQGEIGPLEWTDHSQENVFRKFLALNYYTPTTEAPTGALGAVQQGTIPFDFATAEKDCLSIHWDPYGRVFDATTLEPITSASVNLLVKRATGDFTSMTTADIVGGNLINPQTTIEDGMFSFVVPDGVYKLVISSSNYTFPVTNASGINTNYLKIYSDVYPSVTGEEIIQAGKIEHRDIPLAGVGGYTTVSSPKMMEYSYEARPITQKSIVQGRVSHPFTKIIAYSVKPNASDSATPIRYRQVGEIQADKLGNFKLEINQSTFEPDESFGETDLIKTDLQTLTKKSNYLIKMISWMTKLIGKVQAETKTTTTMKFDPIPTYLEGYAYNTAGQIIPNATVGVYLTFANKAYYQIQTDAKGFFKISSEFLPTMPYEIRYTSPVGSVTKTSTTKFISQNQSYLTQNKINLHSYKNNQGKTIVKPTVTPNNTTGTTGNNPKGSQGTGTQINKALSNNVLIIIAVGLVGLLILLAVLVIFLLKKKQTPPLS